MNTLWYPTKDGDPRALALYERHYSAHQYKDGRKRRLFVGPGQKMVLLTADCRALFVWRKFVSGDGQEGVNCAVFRNEGPLLSSDLIREACHWAEQRWPGQRQYTYVKGSAVKSVNPGYCFKLAGFAKCGVTKWNKLLILERYPAKRGGDTRWQQGTRS